MDYKLMAPGPVPLPDEVLKILSQPTLHHRSPLFEATFLYCLNRLKSVFDTDGEVYILSATGSGAMEASMLNFVNKEESILVVNSGKFGERWLKMAKTYGLSAIEEKVEWGKCLDIASVTEKIKKHKISVVFTQVCETSTGILHPIESLASELNKLSPKPLLIVDAITSILCNPFSMKDWGVDVAIAGSQKAFMLPTGISFVAANPFAIEKMLNTKHTSFYFDLKKEREMNQKKQSSFSSSVKEIQALEWVLNHIEKIGINIFMSEIEERAIATRLGLKGLGLSVFGDSPSKSLSVVVLPKDIDGKTLRKHIEEKYHMTFMGGQDQLEGKVLRIGHMGHITRQDVVRSIDILQDALIEFNYNVAERASKKVKEFYETQNTHS